MADSIIYLNEEKKEMYELDMSNMVSGTKQKLYKVDENLERVKIDGRVSGVIMDINKLKLLFVIKK